MAQNTEDHRLATEGEKTCKTCLLFDGWKCTSVMTHMSSTHERMTCKYHLNEESLKKSGFILQPADIEKFLNETKNDHRIVDDLGWTGEYRMSAKDIVDLIIDMQK